MILSAGEKIRLIARRKNMSIADLARELNTSNQNLFNKLKRDNFTEEDLKEIAAVLGCTVETIFTDLETGEKI